MLYYCEEVYYRVYIKLVASLFFMALHLRLSIKRECFVSAKRFYLIMPSQKAIRLTWH